MTMLEPGRFALAKIGSDRDGDQFTVLYANPEHADSPGYTRDDSGVRSETEVRIHLKERGLKDVQIRALIREAREQWDRGT